VFRVLLEYIRLQLDESAAVVVSRDVRKALEPGVYSALSITSESALRILNESMDAGGRVVFRRMYADYKKFGKWSGI
jgi:nucleolar pre-ribosomal-associated protein 2